jgi:ferredoxin-thioredoxin reductase catalytic subunit
MRLNAIMINRLYHISDDDDTSKLVKEMKNAAKKNETFFCDCRGKKGDKDKDKAADWNCPQCNTLNPKAEKKCKNTKCNCS